MFNCTTVSDTYACMDDGNYVCIIINYVCHKYANTINMYGNFCV